MTDDGGVRPPVPVRPQLPSSPRYFAGRDRELQQLADWLATDRDGPRLIILSGPAGVGKTALALRWLATLRGQDVEGPLFVDLGRGSPGPITPSDALETLLVAMGVDSERIPVADAAREALFRSVTTDRRLVLLLDNALSARQVRPLLPGSAHSVVIVTSRFRLSGLAMDGVDWLEVKPLDESRSGEVLRRMVGDARVAAEPEALHELASLCGGLPLALRVVAARLTTRPKRRLAQEVESLRLERRRLAALALTGDLSVKGIFDLAYSDLPEDAVVVYRLCAWHPGPDFDPEMAAAALDWATTRTETALDDLLEANFLLEADEDRRLSYHDLLAVHARQRSEDTDPVDVRRGAIRRALVWYLDQVVHAEVVIHPHRPRVGERYSLVAGSRFGSAQEALRWLESHRIHLTSAVEMAADNEWNDLVWQLCEAMWGFFLHTRHYRPWLDLHERGIRATQHIGHRRAEARLRSQLGFAYAKLRRYDEAAAENLVALQLSEQEHDVQGMATATSQLGRAARGKGDLSDALRYYDQARRLQEEIGQWRGVALCRRRMGQILTKLGRHDEAQGELTVACEVMRELGDTTQYARTLAALAEAHVRAGQVDHAGPRLREALSLMRDFGSPYYQAEILAQLGNLAERQTDPESAVDSYRAAAELYAEVDDPKADIMLARIAALTDQ